MVIILLGLILFCLYILCVILIMFLIVKLRLFDSDVELVWVWNCLFVVSFLSLVIILVLLLLMVKIYDGVIYVVVLLFVFFI